MKLQPSPSLSCPIALALAVLPAAAQLAAPQEPAGVQAFSLARQSFGLGSEQDGLLPGGGPDYRVQFTQNGFRFTTALGRDAPVAPELAFELVAIERGGERIWSAGPARERLSEGNGLRFSCAPGVWESYQVERDGIEQSFSFDQPLPGTGDLVVRGRIESNLALPARGESADGFAFELPGGGGIAIGAVSGIDAVGTHAQGLLRVDGSFLELVLPGAFVNAAAYPLVLDPLYGPIFNVASSGNETRPDIAYDATTAKFLVVWERYFSSSESDVRGQMVSLAGALSGGLLALDVKAGVSSNPSVASCNLTNQFLVVWSESLSVLSNSDIKCRMISAVTGVLSSIVTVASASASELTPDVGGESSLIDDELIVVWEENGVGIRGRRMLVPASGNPVIANSFVITSDSRDSAPAISKSGGNPGLYLVVWERYFSAVAPFQHDILRAVVNRDGVVTVPAAGLVSSAQDEQDPDVDGDGERFMVVYEWELSSNSGDNHLYCQTVTLNGPVGLSLGSFGVVDVDINDDEIDPVVGFTPEECIVAWSDENSLVTNTYDTLIRGLDSFSCFQCETPQNLGVGAFTSEGQPAIATQYSGGGSGDRALVVWQTTHPVTFSGALDGILFEGTGTTTTSLGGGCGTGGTAYANCAFQGNPAFVHRLENAWPLAPIFLLLGFEEANVACGSCVIVPDLATSFVIPAATTDLDGNGGILMPIPASTALVGLTFIDQWASLAGSPACTFANCDLSTALRVPIQN